MTPLLELIPFSTALSGAVVAVFGLGLTTRDGVLILGALGGGALGLAGIGYAAAAVLS
ncbi:MAG: exopolysaccharide biosynthesis protein [Pseudomonadota bacterium]